MQEHGGGLESVQQDAIARCGPLHRNDIWTCEMWTRPGGIGIQQMQQEGVRPSHITFIGVLNACASVAALDEGKCAHQQIIESGFESNVFVGSSLIDMYAKFGSMEEAQSMFNNMSSHNVVSWNIMILGHVKCGQGQEALELYKCNRNVWNQTLELLLGS
ncbi:unnamed protein product [Sphagnum balticum]